MFKEGTRYLGAPGTPWRALVGCGHCGPPFALIPSPKNHIYSKIILHKFYRLWTLFDMDFLRNKKHATNRNWHWALDELVSPINHIKSFQKYVKVV